MPTYEIEQTATAVLLWRGQAATETDAMDLMAQTAGYRDSKDMTNVLGDDSGVVVREVES
jgi:hypothetical protein